MLETINRKTIAMCMSIISMLGILFFSANDLNVVSGLTLYGFLFSTILGFLYAYPFIHKKFAHWFDTLIFIHTLTIVGLFGLSTISVVQFQPTILFTLALLWLLLLLSEWVCIISSISYLASKITKK